VSRSAGRGTSASVVDSRGVGTSFSFSVCSQNHNNEHKLKFIRGLRQCYPSIDRLDFLSETGNINYLCFLKKNSGNDLHGRPRSVAQMIRPHITFYLWSVVTMCIYRIVSGIFNVE